MKLFKLISLSFFIFVLFFSYGKVSAVDETKVLNTTPTPIILANVNIRDARIISSNSNIFNISFNLTNGEGLQSGIKYGIKLYSIDKNSQPKEVVDEKIYPESITLESNTSLKKEIIYNAPEIFNGDYILSITSESEVGFKFDLVLVDKVTLVSYYKGIKINTETCETKIESKNNQLVEIINNITLSKDDNIKITCTAINTRNEDVRVTPYFETKSKSSYGSVVQTTGGDISPIFFGKLESKNISIVLPHADKSGIYYVKMMLKDGESYSNAIGTSYIFVGVDGVIASINNLFFDKNSYSKGEDAHLVILWNFIGKPTSDFSLEMVVTDKNNNKCGKDLKQILNQNTKNIRTDIPFAIDRSCVNPKVQVTIMDGTGNILDQRNFNVDLKSKSKLNLNNLWPIILVAVFLIIGILIYLKRKNKDSKIGGIFSKLFILLIVACSLIPLSSVKAQTIGFGATDATATISINGSAYSPGNFTPSGVIVATATISLGTTPSSNITLQVNTNDGAYQSFNSAITTPQTKNITAPNIPGGYTVNFRAGNNIPIWENPTITTYFSCFTADTLVVLSDGTEKNIQDIKIGDILKGETRDNKVLSFHRPILSGKLYSLNGGRYFVTEEHPFKTLDGWKSINPEKTKLENIGITVTKLNIGDTLITENGNVVLNKIDGKEGPADTKLFNFILDGDHTYYADGYLVHNKASCNSETLHYCPSTSTCIDSTLMPTESGLCSTCKVGNPCVVNGTSYGTVTACAASGGLATCSGGAQP